MKIIGYLDINSDALNKGKVYKTKAGLSAGIRARKARQKKARQSKIALSIKTLAERINNKYHIQ